MIEELIGRVFTARNVAHLAHWKATGVGSFAKHMALGDFYDGIIDKLDSLVEAYQGYFGLVGEPKATPPKSADIIALITIDAAWITKNRSDICKSVPALENIVDDLVGLYLTTLYKLKNLQ
jgi:DNA-binding ferritin-like protein